MAYLMILDDYPLIFYTVICCFNTQKKTFNFRFYFHLKNVYNPNENLSEQVNQRTLHDA